MSSAPSLEQIRALPKVELHCHLDGAVRTNTLFEAARDAGIPLPASAPAASPEELAPHVQVSAGCQSLNEFLVTFDTFYPVLSVPGLMERVAHEVLLDAADDGIAHRELRFCPALQASDAQSMSDVLHDVLRGLESGARESGVSWGLILSLYRPIPVAQNDAIVSLALDARDRGVVGIDLAGPEDLPGAPNAAAFARARDAGLPITVHAGEAAGPDSIREAIDLLSAQRLGHGVALRQDAALASDVASRGIALECCPTSNVQTAAVAALDEHPFADFRDAGQRVTLNTDDPAVCGITLSHEYALAAQQWQLSLDDLRALSLAAADAAFLSDTQRAALKQRVLAG
ncbi:MAG: adenosine deaminase [Planctomycetota bacterium]|nr:MAG: adenosine deaminase [Planctomycetota bacterium]